MPGYYVLKLLPLFKFFDFLLLLYTPDPLVNLSLAAIITSRFECLTQPTLITTIQLIAAKGVTAKNMSTIATIRHTSIVRTNRPSVQIEQKG